MKYRTAAQNKRIHALLGRINMQPEHKEELVMAFSDSRTKSTACLFQNEADDLIQWLEQQGDTKPQAAHDVSDRSNNMRRKILAICHTMGWYGRHLDKSLILNKGKPVLDFARINAFCIERSATHKTLQQHTAAELPILITIFENVLKSSLK